MFAYLRYFAAVSLVLIVFGAVVVGQVFKSMSGEDLRALTSKTNETLTQAYVNSVWKKHYPRLYADFRSDSRQFFQEMPIVRMNVYSRQGKPLYSSNTSPITISEDARAGQQQLYTNAIGGKSGTRILEESTFLRNSGEQMMGTLVQTVTPISSDQFPDILSTPNQPKSTRVEGVIELYFDITPQWERVALLSNIASITIVLIFIVVIAILIYISRKAELIIAKQHEVNLELTAAASSAEAENREKSQFLANISHELRTPLNAIIGFSEIIKTENSLAQHEVHSDYIRDIHSSGVHLLSLINDILDYSKAEAGKLELELSEIDATKLIKNSMRLVIPRAEEANVTLLEDLPAERIIMYTDGKKLKQVLLNLLSNAVKFTNAGGQVRVTAWNNVIDKSVCLEVSDTGIGIAPKDISRVMTPFGQVDSTLARKYEGTGLGLPLSKKFVETMGGTFGIESEVDKGTTITIKLPMNAPNDNAKHGSDKMVEESIVQEEAPAQTPEHENNDSDDGAVTIASASAHMETVAEAPVEYMAQASVETEASEILHAATPADEPISTYQAPPVEPEVHYSIASTHPTPEPEPAVEPEPLPAVPEGDPIPTPPPPAYSSPSLSFEDAPATPTAPPADLYAPASTPEPEHVPEPATVAPDIPTPPPPQPPQAGIPSIDLQTPPPEPVQDMVAQPQQDGVSPEQNEQPAEPKKLELSSSFKPNPNDDDTRF